MQRFYAFVIFIITATLTQAQINEVPLTYNPILQKLHAEKQQEIQQLLQKKMQSKYGNAAITRDPFIEFGTCLLEGENIEICTDTTNLGNGTTFNILDASALTFGTIAIDSTCVTYTANNNVGFGMRGYSRGVYR